MTATMELVRELAILEPRAGVRSVYRRTAPPPEPANTASHIVNALGHPSRDLIMEQAGQRRRRCASAGREDANALPANGVARDLALLMAREMHTSTRRAPPTARRREPRL